MRRSLHAEIENAKATLRTSHEVVILARKLEGRLAGRQAQIRRIKVAGLAKTLPIREAMRLAV